MIRRPRPPVLVSGLEVRHLGAGIGLAAEGLVDRERSHGSAVDTVSGGADAELAYLGGRRSQDHLPLLTDPLEGGEGSCCRVCGGHATTIHCAGWPAGEVAGSAAAGTASGRLRSANPSCPSFLGSFTGTSGLGLSNRIRKCVHRNRMLQQNRVSEMPSPLS